MTPEHIQDAGNIELDDVGLMVAAIDDKYGQVIPVMAMIELCVEIRRMLDAAKAIRSDRPSPCPQT